MKKILLFVTLALVLTFAGCGNKTEKELIMEEYETLQAEDHVYVKVALDEYEDVVGETEVAYVYFGSPICPACVQVVPYIDIFAKNAGIDTVYYVELEYSSATAIEWGETNKYDYAGTPMVVTFIDGEFERSSFTNRSETSTYVDEIILMFEEFGPNR